VSVVDDVTSVPTHERPTEATAGEPTHRGRIGLYATSFGLMLGAGVALAASSLGSLRSMGLLWLSGTLSVAAIALAVASVVWPRRA
jgi:hypothetical protein